MRDGRITIKIVIVALIVISIGGYALFQARKLIEGPLVTIESPRDGSSTQEANLELTGSAYNIAFMYLNGRKIYTDDTGSFSEHLLLYPGNNVIELKAEDKFGRLTERLIRIYRNI